MTAVLASLFVLALVRVISVGASKPRVVNLTYGSSRNPIVRGSVRWACGCEMSHAKTTLCRAHDAMVGAGG